MTRKVQRAAPWAAAAFFAFASVAMTWPLAAGLTRFVSDPGDPYLATWILDWDARQFLHNPTRLFDADIFYPARLTLAFSENLFGAAVFGFPLRFAGLPPVGVYNVLFLLGMASSGAAAWALAREMTGDGVAAVIAGIFYAFVPFRFSQLPHFQMQWGAFLPLFLLFFWRFLELGRRRDLILYAIFFAWNAIACVHYGIFGGFALAVTAGLELTRRRAWHAPAARRLLGATALSLVAVLPFAIPYFLASRLYHFRRSLGEIVYYSATPASFLSAGVRNKLYGGLTSRFSSPEADLFFGLLVPLLAVAGYVLSSGLSPRTPAPARLPAPRRIAILDTLIVVLAAARLAYSVTGGYRIGPLRVHEPFRLSMALFASAAVRLSWRFPAFLRDENLAAWLRSRRRSPAVCWAVAMIATGVVVALGGRFFAYRELYEILRPVLGAIRAPARGIVLAHLGLGVLAAFGVSALRFRLGRAGRSLVPAAAALLTLGELRAAPVSWFDQVPAAPAAIAWTDAHHPPGGVLELPMKISDDLCYMLWATGHDFPIANGYSGFFPKTTEQIRAAFLSDPVPPEAVSLLHRARISTILFHRGRANASEQVSLANFLSHAIAEGSIVPVRAMGIGADDTVVCADSSSAAAFSPSAEDRRRTLEVLAHPLPLPPAPEGWYEEPNDGDVIRGSTVRGNGWAASADGIARIAVLLDGRDIGSATYGQYRPAVRHVKPYVQCGDFCGYGYRIDGVPPGRHTIQTRFFGRQGGTAAPPKIRIRIAK